MTIEEYNNLIVSSSLNGNIKPGDTSVWHSLPSVNDDFSGYAGNELLEILQNKADYGLDKDDTHISFRPRNWVGSVISVTFDGTMNASNTNGPHYAIFGYRPVMEYVDNSKSTNIFY